MAELVYVLEFSDEVPRRQVAALMRSILGVPAVTVIDQGPLLRAVEMYEVDRLHLVDAYLVSCAERAGEAAVASFGRVIDRVPLTCVEPGVGIAHEAVRRSSASAVGPGGALTLQSYVWADQFVRLDRLHAALTVAVVVPAMVRRGQAVDLVREFAPAGGT